MSIRMGRFKCPCCGCGFSAAAATGFYSGGGRGLDMNPRVPELEDIVLMCPCCGYASADMDEAVTDEVRACVASEGYRSLRSGISENEAVTRAYLAARLLVLRSEPERAAETFLLGHWCAQNSGLESDPCLAGAIEQFSLCLEGKEDAGAAAVLIDCMRQAGRFAEAAENAEKLLRTAEGERLAGLLEFELSLIGRRDSGAHGMDEVPHEIL